MTQPRKGRRRPNTAVDLPATKTLIRPGATDSRTPARFLADDLRSDLDDLLARAAALSRRRRR